MQDNEREVASKVQAVEIGVLSPSQIEIAWTLYCNAFAETSTKTPRPQPLDRVTFEKIMLDEDFQKVFFGEKSGEPKAMMILTDNMKKVAFWINNPFLEKHYPEEYRDQKIYYVVGILTDPSVRGKPQKYLQKIIEEMASRVVRDNKILLQDFSPESAPNYADIIERYYGNKIGDHKIVYTDLDRQVHGTVDALNNIDESAVDVNVYGESEGQELQEIMNYYNSYYDAVNQEAVQPQSFSREAIEETIQNDSITTLYVKEGNRVKGMAVISRDITTPSGLLSKDYISKKYPENDFIVIVALAGDRDTKMNLIKKICIEAKKENRKIYYVGSEKACSDDLALIKEITGDNYNHDGSQNYGVFKMIKETP